MASIDVQKFLEPVSDDAPSGEDLEYDAAFGELERSAQGKPEQRMGDQVIAAEPPKWREVLESAQALMARSHDLRIAVHLMHAGVNTEGLPALADGLKLIRGLVENFWDTIYPPLDEEDDNDPTIRLNSLNALVDRAGFLHSLSLVPLVESKAAGVFNLRHVRMAEGEINPGEDETAPDSSLIDAAFLDCDLDGLTATAEAASTAAEELAAIDAYLREQVGVQLAPDLKLLQDEIAAIKGILSQHLADRGVGSEDDAAAAGGAQAGQSGGGLGSINSREDAIRVIDRLTEYFRRSEPSSPVPILLNRAKRLIAKDFMEILEDLAPDGLTQAKLLSGKDQDG